ncbi:MAG: toll/interleukin-1 receptor domain-containing protein [Deltaproteobacteria bacterium]|nr:toll/interleukin-1 receptor domain-containing protein [Deltaproteobacteria bacterium]
MRRIKIAARKVPHLFISHSSADKALIDEFVDFLQTGIGLTHDQVFCTSLEGIGIPKGKDFIEFIHEKIQDPFLVIMVVTPSYYESSFCLCELGAAWAMSHSSFPLICPPLEYSELEAVLKNKEVGKIDSPSDLDCLRDRIIEDGEIENPSPTGRWNVKRDQFLKKIKKLIPKLDGLTKVAIEKYIEMKDNYETALQDAEDLQEQLEKTKNTIKKLKKLKDGEAVTDVLLEDMDEWDQFKILVKDAKDRLDELTDPAIEALYYDYAGGTYSPSYWDKDWLRDEVKESQERGYIEGAESDDITPNKSNPRIAKVIKKLDKLEHFLAHSSTDFDEAFIEKHDIQPNMTIRDFWESFLGLVSN